MVMEDEWILSRRSHTVDAVIPVHNYHHVKQMSVSLSDLQNKQSNTQLWDPLSRILPSQCHSRPTCTYLPVSSRPSKHPVGSLPGSIPAQYCSRHGRYIHFCTSDQSVSLGEMEEFGNFARFKSSIQYKKQISSHLFGYRPLLQKMQDKSPLKSEMLLPLRASTILML